MAHLGHINQSALKKPRRQPMYLESHERACLTRASNILARRAELETHGHRCSNTLVWDGPKSKGHRDYLVRTAAYLKRIAKP